MLGIWKEGRTVLINAGKFDAAFMWNKLIKNEIEKSGPDGIYTEEELYKLYKKYGFL
jgi:hypothetical protein